MYEITMIKITSGVKTSQDLVATKLPYFHSIYEMQIYDTVTGNPLNTLIEKNEF